MERQLATRMPCTLWGLSEQMGGHRGACPPQGPFFLFSAPHPPWLCWHRAHLRVTGSYSGKGPGAPGPAQVPAVTQVSHRRGWPCPGSQLWGFHLVGFAKHSREPADCREGGR